MGTVLKGANVFDYLTAQLLREVEKHNHELIDIFTPRELQDELGCTEQDIYDASGRLCYFGAILTDEGADYYKDAMRKMVKVNGTGIDGEQIQAAMQDDMPDDTALKIPPTA